jgi:hypothetical protein
LECLGCRLDCESHVGTRARLTESTRLSGLAGPLRAATPCCYHTRTVALSRSPTITNARSRSGTVLNGTIAPTRSLHIFHPLARVLSPQVSAFQVTILRASHSERLAGGTRGRGSPSAIAITTPSAGAFLNRSRRPRVHSAALRLTRYFSLRRCARGACR